MSVEEYATLREPDDVRSELVRGHLVREPRPAAPHGYVQVELARRLAGFAVEVVSPGNTVSELQERTLDYLDAGSRMVWVVDPALRTATAYRSRHDVEIIGESEELDGGEALPGLRIRLTEVLPA